MVDLHEFIVALFRPFVEKIMEIEELLQKDFTMNEEVLIEGDSKDGEQAVLAIRVFTDGAVTVSTRLKRDPAQKGVVVFDSKNSMSHELRAIFKFVAYIAKHGLKAATLLR